MSDHISPSEWCMARCVVDEDSEIVIFCNRPRGHGQGHACEWDADPCGEWSLSGVEPQEVCPACGHYAAVHACGQCSRCIVDGDLT